VFIIGRSSLFGLLAAVLLAGCSPRPSTDPILIAHLTPLSGPERTAGERARQGITLAVEEVNGSDEKVGGRRVECLHADSRGGSDEAVRLVTINKVIALLGATDAAQADQVARAVQGYNVPLLTPAAVLAPPADGLFSTNIAPARQGGILALFASQELKAKKAIVLADSRSLACPVVAGGFVREFNRTEGARAEQWSFDSENSLLELAKKAQMSKPDVLLLCATAQDFARLRSAKDAEESKIPILFGGEEEAWAMLNADGNASRDVYAVSTFFVADDSPRVQEFIRKYQAKFNEPPDLSAASAYDGARLLFEALRRKSGKIERARDLFAGLEGFEMLSGSLTLDREDHCARRPVFVVQKKEGTLRLVKRFEANVP
jgi:branched-chain amino acid transport system substrate-binding protein